ncbi:MAG: Rho termination factor N-terminal domain-containing protein [Phycisphaeraceae bacterium]
MGKWSNKDERQYEHIKESTQERGTDEGRAEQIAARTVNKQRREEGRTPKITTEGTGNPNVPLESRSKQELLNLAREMDIHDRSKMDKDTLIDAIQKHQH